MREVAELILQLCGTTGSGVVYKPLPADDPKQRCPDITRARETIVWEPRVSAKEGLEKTIGWFADKLERPEPSPTSR